MKKQIIAVLITCLPILQGKAQNSGEISSFNFGYTNYDVSSFSAFMPSPALELQNHAFRFSFDGSSIMNRKIFGFGFAGFWQPKYAVDSFQIRINGFDYKLELGYAAVMRSKFFFAPVLGLGGGFDQINIHNTNETTAANIAQNPGRQLIITQGKALADLSLRTNFLFGGQDNMTGNEKFMLGFSIGYATHYGIGKWRYEKVKIDGGPEGLRNMIYAQLNIGFLTFNNTRTSDAPFEESMQ